MSRDYKPTTQKQKPANKGNAFVTGLLVGVILGIGISVAVAIMVTGGKSPFVKPDENSEPVQTAEPTSGEKTATPSAVPTESSEDKQDPSRFDFYKILPGESQVTEQEIEQSKEAQQAAPAVENYFLQVGAFQTEAEADNMKAKLALMGLEAVVQTATVPDKGVWHRVRVGPYSDLDQIAKARAELAKNGFKADLIKIHSNVPDQ